MHVQLHDQLPVIRARSSAAAAAALALAAGAAVFGARAAQLDLTLDRAIEMALANQRAIRTAQFALQSEELGRSTAQSAFELKVVPTGTVGRLGTSGLTTATGYNSSVGVQVSRRLETTGTLISLGPSYNRSGGDANTTLTLNIEQPLMRGWDQAVNLDPVRRAQFAVASSQRALEAARTNAALEAIGAYYAVLREKQLFDVAESQRVRIEQHTAVAEAKERSGIIGPMDLLRAQVRLKETEDAANQARVNAETTLNRLRRALDIALDTGLHLAPAPEVRLGGGDLEGEALERRAEIVQLRADLDEAVRAVDVARKNVRPEVTLHIVAGQATQIDPFLAQYVPTTTRTWNVYLQSSSDLTRTAEKNALAQAELRVETARMALETRIEDVRRQVREQRLQLADARVRIGLREEQIRQAEARLALAQVKFSHDMASNLDVLDAETELQRAEAVVAAARADYAVGVYQLRAMAGHLLNGRARSPSPLGEGRGEGRS